MKNLFTFQMQLMLIQVFFCLFVRMQLQSVHKLWKLFEKWSMDNCIVFESLGETHFPTDQQQIIWK